MKVYQITFDTTMITVICENYVEVIKILQEEDEEFILIERNLHYRFSEDYVERCNITDVTDKRGIIQYELH